MTPRLTSPQRAIRLLALRLRELLFGWTCHRCGQRRRGGSCGPCVEEWVFANQMRGWWP